MSMLNNVTSPIINGGVFYAVQGPENTDTMGRMKEMMEDDERQKVMAWVSPIDASARQLDVSTIRHPGTGEWLLNSDIFHQWELGAGRALWCPGIPGAGKTVLVSLAIDHLLAIQIREPISTMGVAWIYFDYKEALTQTPDAILLSLIRQLALFSEELYNILRSAYKKNPGSRPSAKRLIPDMRMLMREFSKVFIVVDALDECSETHQDAILEVLAALQNSGANILITSRDHLNNRISDSQLFDFQQIDIRGDVKDITEYVNARVKQQTQLARIVQTDPGLHGEILKAIIESCQGMFLMAKLYIESLRKKLNSRDVLEALKVLPKSFRGIYDEAMQRLESDVDYSEFALQVLSFIIHARRPLTVVELQHLLATKPGDIDIDDKHVTDKDILTSVCAGLVVVDDTTDIVRLVHFTAQEYFNSIRASRFPSGDQDMGHACLTYLSFDAFRHVANLPDSLHRYALLKYIVHYWHMHVLDHQEALRIPLFAFFRDETLLHAYSCFMQKHRQEYFGYYWSSDDNSLDYQHTGLHAAAAAGLRDVVGWLISEGANVNSRDFKGKTALMYSSELGFLNTVDLLITSGADINAHSTFDGTALQGASGSGHEAVVRLLLENSANVNGHDEKGRTALHWASRRGHEAVVKLLLHNGTDINAHDEDGNTALQRASRGGHEAIVRLLLENGANVNAHDEGVCTALHWASGNGHEAVMKLLLENGADVNARDKESGIALHWASGDGHDAVIKLLLENGADVNARDDEGCTALHWASEWGHEAVIKLLLENGAEVNARDDEGSTALNWASEWGHEAAIKSLLVNGADVNARDEEGGTAP